MAQQEVTPNGILEQEIGLLHKNAVMSPEEFGLSLLLSGGALGKEYGLSFCSSCRKMVYAKKTYKNGQAWLIKYCHYENKVFETLAEKTTYAFNNTDVPMEKLPHFSFKSFKEVVTEEDIINFKDIQNILVLVTDRCNSKCKICYDKEWKPRSDMSNEFLKKTLTLFKEKRILLYGGDPTVREDLPEIIKIVNDSGNYSAMFSNCLKLADAEYLRKNILDANLNFLYFSFSGFNEDIYEKIWGGAHEYEIKMKAWENLIQEHKQRNLIGKLRVAIAPTFVRGVNDDQVKDLLNFALKNDFISELLDRPLFMPDNTSFNAHLDPDFHIMSRPEIDQLVCDALGLPHEYFDLFYDVRLEFIKLLKNTFPKLDIMYPRKHHIYLLREEGRFVPLFSIDELKKLSESLKKKKLYNMFTNKKYLELALCFVKSRFNPTEIEANIAKKKIFRVAPGSPPAEFFLNSTQITSLCYGSNGLAGIKSWV